MKSHAEKEDIRRLVPTNKHDHVACDMLMKASDEQVVLVLPELLEWLQDMNWPVAARIVERIKVLGKHLVSPVRTVLNGKDAVWKYWLITCLIPVTDREVIDGVKAELIRLAKFPEQFEIDEGLNVEASELLKTIEPNEDPKKM